MFFYVPLVAMPKPKLADELAFVRWMRTAAHPFQSEAPSEVQMQALAARLAGAKIVGIGEATHGTHEDQAFKAELMKALVRAGKTSVIVLEANRQVGVDLDGFINGRGGDLPALLRSPSFFRIWRTDEFAGLMLWLRAYNIQAAHPVNVIGIDIQDAGVDADLALRFLAVRDAEAASRLGAAFAGLLPGPKAERFSVWQAKASKDVFAAAARAAQELETLFADHRADWSADPAYVEAAYASRTTRQAFDAFELNSGRGNPEKAGLGYYSRRDRSMAANLLDRLQDRNGAFWAHDTHVLGDLPASETPAGYTWVGRELRRSLGSRYQTVTFAWSRGAFRAQTLGQAGAGDILHRRPMVPQTLPNDGPGDLGGLLGRSAFDRCWLDLRTLPAQAWATRFGSTPYGRGWAGWGIDPREWRKGDDNNASLRPGTDILVWFRMITPSHMLPGDDF